MKSVVLYLIIAASALTFAECRKAMYTVAFATAMIDVFAFRYGYMHGGRLAVGTGTLGNSNDLAAYLLTGLPFCAYALFSSRAWWKKLFWAGVILAGMNYVLKTGSRGALISLALVCVYVFYKSSAKQKALMVTAGIAGLAVVPLVVPERIYLRYATIFVSDDTDVATTQEEAIGSAHSRMALLQRSIDVTLANPVFGVGPGMFPIAAFGHSGGQVSHNMYTQLSSETGIP
jgi:O-antigen ligase